MRRRKKHKPLSTEKAQCIYCKGEFIRTLRGNARKRQVCDRPNCQKIKRLRNSVAKFSDMKTGSPSFMGTQGQYHGGYTE